MADIIAIDGGDGTPPEPNWRSIFGRAADRPRRVFSLVLIVAGLVLLTLTLHVVDERIVGPVVLISLGLLLLWRRAR